MQVKPVYQRNTVSLKSVSHWVKKKNEIFEAVEENNASKKRKTKHVRRHGKKRVNPENGKVNKGPNYSSDRLF